MLFGDKGNVEIVSGVTYLGHGTQDSWKHHLHEIFHALGFVQLCAPGAIIEKNSRWGKNDHLKYSGDIMSDRLQQLAVIAQLTQMTAEMNLNNNQGEYVHPIDSLKAYHLSNYHKPKKHF